MLIPVIKPERLIVCGNVWCCFAPPVLMQEARLKRTAFRALSCTPPVDLPSVIQSADAISGDIPGDCVDIVSTSLSLRIWKAGYSARFFLQFL